MAKMIFHRNSVLSSLVILWSSTLLAQDPIMNCSRVFAISGGSNPTANHLRYYTNMERVQEVFQGCPISNFMATGNENDKVTMVYEKIPQMNSYYSFEKIKLDSQGLPVLTDKKVMGGLQGAAKFEDIKQGVLSWVQTSTSPSPSEKPVVFYVTDHGSQVNGQGMVALWNRTYLSPLQLNEILGQLPDGQKAMMFFDQCYGGEMLQAMWDKNGKLRKNTCGIAAASPGQLAFSGGGTMRNLQKMIQKSKNPSLTYEDIYQAMKNDTSIISVPILSSDVYANEWFKKQYSANLDQNIANKKLIDPKVQCFSFMNFRDPSHQSFNKIPPQLFQRLKDYWKERLSEYQILNPIGLDIDEIRKDMLAKEKLMNEAFQNYNDHLMNVYNPHMVELIKSQYPHFNDYLTLKEKINQKGSLSAEEQIQLQKYQFEMDMLKTAIKDEATLKIKGMKGPFTHQLSPQTLMVVGQFNQFNSNRTEEWNKFYKAKEKMTKLTTLNALDKMVKKNDVAAIEELLNIVECEKTPLLSSPPSSLGNQGKTL